MSDFALGCLPPTFDPGDADYHFAKIAQALPAPVLPVKAPLPPGYPWDQGNEGTCVGHGIGLAVVVAIHRKTGKWIVDDAKSGHALARDLYWQGTHDPTYQRGAQLRDVARAARNVGALGKDGTRHRIATYRTMLPSTDIVHDIERAIGAGYVVATGWRWPNLWMARDYSFDTLPDPPADSPIAGGHCVGLCQATMKHPYANAPAGSALREDGLIANSWDLRWTKDGLAYVDTALIRAGWMFDALVIEA